MRKKLHFCVEKSTHLRNRESPGRRYTSVMRAWALALLCLSLLCPSSLKAADAQVVLSGHVPRQVKTATKVGRAPADEPVSLSLVVRLDQALLDQTLSQI